MHSPNCKSLIVLTTYPPQYQECDCGEDYIPQSWSPTLRKMAKDKYQELKSRVKHYPECTDSVATVCICQELSSLKDRLERIHHHEINELRWMNGLIKDDLIEEIKKLYNDSDGDFDFVIWSLEKKGDNH